MEMHLKTIIYYLLGDFKWDIHIFHIISDTSICYLFWQNRTWVPFMSVEWINSAMKYHEIIN